MFWNFIFDHYLVSRSFAFAFSSGSSGHSRPKNHFGHPYYSFSDHTSELYSIILLLRNCAFFFKIILFSKQIVFLRRLFLSLIAAFSVPSHENRASKCLCSIHFFTHFLSIRMAQPFQPFLLHYFYDILFYVQIIYFWTLIAFC